MGDLLGLPEAEGVGVFVRDMDKQAVSGTCASALRGSGASVFEEAGPGDGIKDIKKKVQPHKIRYYIERRDPDFEPKMNQVLEVYKKAKELRENGQQMHEIAILSYDEKPGIQALGNRTDDLVPVAGIYPFIARDPEYTRYGTVSLMAGIDLVTGEVQGRVVDRHKSKEFVEFLKGLDERYAKDWTIWLILDNHSIHISKETNRYLATVPERFRFIFTPKHGSWLNLIESFFSKVARTVLRGIRVKSKDELKQRILQYLQEVNENPVVFCWKKFEFKDRVTVKRDAA